MLKVEHLYEFYFQEAVIRPRGYVGWATPLMFVCNNYTVSIHVHVHGPFGKVRHNLRIESNIGCTYVRKAHYAYFLCTKNTILLAGKGARKISFLAHERSPSKMHLTIYPKSSISKIVEVIKYFIEKTKTLFLTVCFAVIKLSLVIVLTWFL